MAQSKTSKKIFNMVYGLGAAVVIIGALFKIMHWDLFGIPGGYVLALGMIVEAFVFAFSAFEPVEDEMDWSLVFPELEGGKSKVKNTAEIEEAQSMLSQKLDNMLKEAKLDAGLVSGLTQSIQNFKGAADNIAPAVDSIAATNKYSEQLSLAAAQMESLNSLYKVQLESASKQADVNASVAENAAKLKEQMESLTANLASLNSVYGGMLSAMHKS